MTDSPADVVRWLMVGLGLGIQPSTRSLGTPWPINTSLEPAQPDDCITIKNTVGMDDGRTMADGIPHAHFGIQIRVRSTDERTGWIKADSIRATLATQVRMISVTLPSGSTYNVACIAHIGQVIPIGKETPNSKRNVFTLNVTLALSPQP